MRPHNRHGFSLIESKIIPEKPIQLMSMHMNVGKGAMRSLLGGTLDGLSTGALTRLPGTLAIDPAPPIERKGGNATVLSLAHVGTHHGAQSPHVGAGDSFQGVAIHNGLQSVNRGFNAGIVRIAQVNAACVSIESENRLNYGINEDVSQLNIYSV